MIRFLRYILLNNIEQTQVRSSNLCEKNLHALGYLQPVRANAAQLFSASAWKRPEYYNREKLKACHWSTRVSLLETARGCGTQTDHVTINSYM